MEGSTTLATLYGEKASIVCEVIKDDGNILTTILCIQRLLCLLSYNPD